MHITNRIVTKGGDHWVTQARMAVKETTDRFDVSRYDADS